MSGAMGEAGDADAFAELLRGLKERSGLSYGTLAKRLHMSTSTLHRYCRGSAVPTEYAPAERFARVCRATPEELIELHRRWILADAARGRKRPGPGGAVVRGAGADEPEGAPRADAWAPADGNGSPDASGSGGGLSDVGVGTEPVSPSPERNEVGDAGEVRDSGASRDPGEPRQSDEAGEPGASDGSDEPAVGGPVRCDPVRPHRRRFTLIVSAAAAAALGAVVLAVNLPPSGGDGSGRKSAETVRTGTGTPSGAGTARAPDKGRSPSATPSPSRSAKTGRPSASSSESSARSGGDDGEQPDSVRVNVATRPFVYDSPCSQHFLVDREPERVGPPASERDAPRWAAAYGAASSGEQRVALTVQGTGKETVVLEALHVRVVAKEAPLAWNDYSMGVGCGGSVETKSFDIDLDNGSPTVTTKNGQRDFPYKISESDPEVFYVTAHTKAHDVRWDLALEWSSGNRHGTVHIDNRGTPFRTSADTGRPGYDYPLGGSEWVER
ncbi:helix-turn-helix domain-containing protein [Streptomyces platensis]|uniref:helix-turn-helix domain-containing protein n=1 Tax=Streptomyces platensis TaxID=58346 RepID=UPI001F1EA738|nr:helix-turn-helix transcriptional regulator [Streptomyces platensis]MCF3143942.1 helix-turn-helix domain-containing protein [Streptomyces platensis]